MSASRELKEFHAFAREAIIKFRNISVILHIAMDFLKLFRATNGSVNEQAWELQRIRSSARKERRREELTARPHGFDAIVAEKGPRGPTSPYFWRVFSHWRTQKLGPLGRLMRSFVVSLCLSFSLFLFFTLSFFLFLLPSLVYIRYCDKVNAD